MLKSITKEARLYINSSKKFNLLVLIICSFSLCRVYFPRTNLLSNLAFFRCTNSAVVSYKSLSSIFISSGVESLYGTQIYDVNTVYIYIIYSKGSSYDVRTLKC